MRSTKKPFLSYDCCSSFTLRLRPIPPHGIGEEDKMRVL
jgi:hypothetical protein